MAEKTGQELVKQSHFLRRLAEHIKPFIESYEFDPEAQTENREVDARFISDAEQLAIVEFDAAGLDPESDRAAIEFGMAMQRPFTTERQTEQTDNPRMVYGETEVIGVRCRLKIQLTCNKTTVAINPFQGIPGKGEE